jgi:outer membrane autotransporter protein
MERLLGVLRMGRLAHRPLAALDWLGGWHSARPLLLMALIATAPRGFSQPFIIPTIEAPGVQITPLVGNTGVAVEDFNSLPLGNKPKGFQTPLGMYSGGVIKPAQPAGGAFETQYFQVASAKNPVTLMFNTPQRYFGLWWSNANPQFLQSNTLTFSLNANGQTNLQYSFNTGNLLALINEQSNPSAYFGNPNPGTFNPSTKTAAYAFVNFFAAPNVTINDVVFSNNQVTFSSDNHTIASSYPPEIVEVGSPGGPPEVVVPPGEPPPVVVVPPEGPPEEILPAGDAPPEVVLPPGEPPAEVLPPGQIEIGSGTDVHAEATVIVPPASSLQIDKGGEVIVDGPTIVVPAGDLMGDGTIMTPELLNQGVVSPGFEEHAATIGTLTVDGNYEQGPDGVLGIGVAGPQCPQSDKLVISGSAKLDGTLVLTSVNFFHPSSGDHYTILTATGGVKGMFSNVVDTLNTKGLTRADVYAPDGMVIAYLPPGNGVLTLSTATPIPLNSPCTVTAVLVSAIDPDVEQLAAPFDIWFSLANTQRFNLEARFDDIIAGSTGFVSNVSYPKPPPTGKEVTEEKGVVTGKGTIETPAPLAPGPRWGVWVTGFGDFVNIDDEGSIRGYNYTTGGVTVGIDYRVTDHFVVGFMGGYAHTWTDLKPTGSVDVDTGWGGAYAGYFNQGFYVLGSAFGGGNSFSTSRASLIGGNANGSSNSEEWSTFLSAGYDFHFGHLTTGPTAAVQYSYINMNGFTETSSFAPLKVNGESEESWRTDLGFRAWYTLQAGAIGVRPFVRAAWEHEYKESALPVTASLADVPGTPATFFGPSLGHDSAVVNAGVAVQWTPTISTYVSYDGQLGRNRYDSNGVSGGIRISF